MPLFAYMHSRLRLLLFFLDVVKRGVLKGIALRPFHRLQNCPYFCVFKYARAVN